MLTSCIRGLCVFGKLFLLLQSGGEIPVPGRQLLQALLPPAHGNEPG